MKADRGPGGGWGPLAPVGAARCWAWCPSAAFPWQRPSSGGGSSPRHPGGGVPGHQRRGPCPSWSRAGAPAGPIAPAGGKARLRRGVRVLTDSFGSACPTGRRNTPLRNWCKDCDCEHHGIFRAALTHTVRIALFFAAGQPGAGRGHPLCGGRSASPRCCCSPAACSSPGCGGSSALSPTAPPPSS